MEKVEDLVKEITEQILSKVNRKPFPDNDPCPRCATKGQCMRVCPDRISDVLSQTPDRIGSAPPIGSMGVDIAKIIDHTLLKPDATLEEIQILCAEGAKYGFKSVCVNSFWAKTCRKFLENYPVEVCVVVGFPLGACITDVKAYEARQAIKNGATEIDMVMNIGALKGGDYALVEKDIRQVIEASHTVVKVILETCLLTDREKIIGCEIAKRAGATFVKTSTGFSSSGATASDIALMRRVVGPQLGVKASGGVRDLPTAKLMVYSGATRIGASASVKIVTS